jgi:hypothetical protein
MGFWFWLDKKVKVVLVKVVGFLFTKLYNVSHFAGIPAVPRVGVRNVGLK